MLSLVNMMVGFTFFVSLLLVFSAGVTGQYGNCTGQLDKIGDGACDYDNNNIDCGYDGGDCCECSCTNDRLYPCGIWGFNCSDPDITGHEGACYNETSLVRPCASDAPVTWLVNDTASAMSLAGAVNCSGGTFNVIWLGSVLVNRTFYIPNGTTLYVTGEDSGAEVKGDGKTRLFMGVGVNLHIKGLTLSNGNATYGGAIAATRSSIFMNQTVFSGNTASTYGGAINVGITSSLVWEGNTMFIGNYASLGGGAVAVSMGSIIFSNFPEDDESFGGAYLWDGVTLFANNTANYGGALYISLYSNVSWYGETSFIGNTANYFGGALYIIFDSIVLWYGETSFIGNMASDSGGALFVSTNSSVSWDGNTSFIGNTADVYGGGGVVYLDSNVSWYGETYFTGNTANYIGGALYIYSECISSWYGKTSFIGNTANYYGGALYISWYSSVSWYGETSFENNVANYTGGALHISLNSIVSWDGATSFIGNTANYFGGALYIIFNSTVSSDGNTPFIDNIADKGGALYISWYSNVSWYDKTSFIGNTANDSGGALFINSDSTVSWDGETSFIGNTVNFIGGAVYINLNSIVSWDGATSFIGNTANSSGGALLISTNSYVSWDGNTSFISNTAKDLGGALGVSWESIIVWNGNTSFTGNVAGSSGGAIYVGSRSKISAGGNICFLDNEAAIDGGAAYVLVGHDDATPSSFISDNNSAVLFQGNTCGGNGGAIVFIGEVATRFPPMTTFLENTAGVAGGAIYMSGVTFGMLFEGVIFKSNSAVIGGGLYSSGSGIAVTEVIVGTIEHYPTIFIGCEFIGNTASKTGGTMDSGGGRDLVENTSFVGNTASLGGALKIVGTTSLIGCDFVNNLSGDGDGPGISNDGVITSASNCSFVGNIFNCQTGSYLGYNDTNASFDTVCKGCDVQCTGCTVKDKEPICLEELEHSYSTGGNATLKSLLIERGYWRATNRSMDILACYNKDACLGGRTEDQGYCSEGYEGPYCSVCSNRYTASLGFTCSKCSDNAAGGIALAVAVGVVFMVVFVAFLSYMLSGKMEGADQGIVARVTRFIPLQSVKIVIVVWQILTQFSTVANVVFPSVYRTFLDGVDILNFNLTWLLSAGCIIDTDFHDQLLLVTLGPLVCLVILGGTYVAAMHRCRHSETARGIVRRKHVSMMLLLTFLVYSSVSSTLFKTFACDKLDDGKNYLRADYRIECDSSKHVAIQIYAGLMVILYVVGIPAFYGVLLYKTRETLVNTAGSEDESTKVIADLWKPYKPDRFYYEIIECIRRVLLTGALVFIYPNAAAQIAVALMMATFFIFVSEALAPYSSKWDTWCSRAGHGIVFTSMFLALLLKVDVSGERASSQRVFEWVLISAHLCLVLVVVVEAIAMIVTWRQEVKESAEPRFRPSLGISSPGVGRTGTILEEDGVSPPRIRLYKNSGDYMI